MLYLKLSSFEVVALVDVGSVLFCFVLILKLGIREKVKNIGESLFFNVNQ